MEQLLNALLLKLDGDEKGENKPSKLQVAAVWTGVGVVVSKLLS